MYNLPPEAFVPDKPPKKRRGRLIGMRKINGQWVQTDQGPSASTAYKNGPKKVKNRFDGQHAANEVGKSSGQKGGRKKGQRNSPESIAKMSKSQRASVWRKHAPNKGSNSLQSASGLGEADYSLMDIGRVYPRFLNEGWHDNDYE